MANRIPLILGSSGAIEQFRSPDTLVLQTSSPDPSLRTTQTGAGNVLVVEDSSNPDATPFVVDSDGRLIVGHTSAIGVKTGNAALQLQSADAVESGLISATMWSSTLNTSSSLIELARSKSTTTGTHTAVAVNDRLGTYVFSGSDGSDLQWAVRIEAFADGTVGTAVMPGRLEFSVTRHGDTAPATALTLNANSQVYGPAGTTDMTQGFLCFPSASGAPTGAPTLPAGRVPLYFNDAANTLHVYDGGWLTVTFGSGGGGSAEPLDVSAISTNTNAVNFTTYIIEDTLDLTLPASPSVGDWVQVVNRSGLADSNILRNGNNIEGAASDLLVDSVHFRATLAYVNATHGWVIVST